MSSKTKYRSENPAVRVLVFLCQLTTSVWAFLILTGLPLYVHDRYSKMGTYKFKFFLHASLACLLPALVFSLIYLGLRAYQDAKKGKKWKILALWQNTGTVDKAVLAYLLAVILSYVCSPYQETAWAGASGWFMGLRTQLLLVLGYFMVSRWLRYEKIVLAGHFAGSAMVFLLGILHRFLIDPLGMYEGIDSSYFIEYLSTVGQSSWYSSYVCTVLAIGVACFFFGEDKKIRIGAGLYCAVGFATVVTQNSDSAYMAMGILFLGLFCIACRSLLWMERFFETLILMLGSFKCMGVLQIVFAERAIELDSLSVFISQSTATWVLLLAVTLAYIGFLLWRSKNEKKLQVPFGKWMKWGALGILALALTGYVLLVWLNTTGRLEAILGWSSENQYLLFDYKWGNFRGFTWKFSVGVFAAMPFVRKLFGAGPDSFAAYCYANEEHRNQLIGFFGENQTLTNAHNEFLNVLLCLGILGLAAFLAIFVTAYRRFGRSGRADWLVFAGALVLLTYGAHNLFCYQQVCCTPFFFIILGMAEHRLTGLLRNNPAEKKISGR